MVCMRNTRASHKIHVVFPALVLRPRDCETLAAMMADSQSFKETFGGAAARVIDVKPYSSYLRMPLCAKPDDATGGTSGGVYWVDGVWESADAHARGVNRQRDFSAAALYEMGTLRPLEGQQALTLDCLQCFYAHRARQAQALPAPPASKHKRKRSSRVAVAAAAGAILSPGFCRAAALAYLGLRGVHDVQAGDLRVGTETAARTVSVRCRKPVPCPLAHRTHGNASTAVFKVQAVFNSAEISQRCMHSECSSLAACAVEKRAPWVAIEVFGR
jgi:hypothetical protein